jgi:hypothetical protein
VLADPALRALPKFIALGGGGNIVLTRIASRPLAFEGPDVGGALLAER